MNDETDETITRIAAALRQLPTVDPSHKAQVLVAVAAERERAREARLRAARRWRLAGSIGVAAAAALVVLVWRREGTARRAAAGTTGRVAAITPVPSRPSSPVASAPTQLAARGAA